jgi:hypothetical protein
MKRVFFIFVLGWVCFITQPTFAQQEPGNELLNWIIKKDHLNPLNTKTNISTFYAMGTDPLTITPIIDYIGNTLSHKCLKDFMTEDESNLFNSQIKQPKQLRWRKTGYKLKTTFFTEEQYPQDPDNIITYHYLSVPIFLNKEQTRAIVGESFSAGVAFGRGDLLLCELKNGQWQEIARVATESE